MVQYDMRNSTAIIGSRRIRHMGNMLCDITNSVPVSGLYGCGGLVVDVNSFAISDDTNGGGRRGVFMTDTPCGQWAECVV